MLQKKQKNRSDIPQVLLMVLLDAVLINIASWGALYLRGLDSSLESLKNAGFFHTLALSCIPCTAIALIVIALFGFYKVAWEYAGQRELLNLGGTCIIIAALYMLYIYSFKYPLPRSFPFLYSAMLFLLLAVSRLGLRTLKHGPFDDNKSNMPKKRTLIIGAGTAGAMAVREFQNDPRSENLPVAIIDDDAAKKGMRIRGVRVEGNREELAEVAKKYAADEIVFCIPSASHTVRNELLGLCAETGLTVKALPTLSQVANGEVTVSQLRSVSIEDLLGRPQVHTENFGMERRVRGQTVLVTGGGGSIGSELCRQLAAMGPAQLIVFDIYENNAYDIQQELRVKHPELELIVLIGSVRDEERVRYVFDTYRPKIVCHAAAHKHVPLMEDSPAEAIKNNIFGTYNVAKAAADFHTGLFILVSTDKAVNPTNVMGASKRMCEMIVQSMNSHRDTRYIAVRFGNVMGSNGSVIPLFRKQIAAGGPVTVTDKRITRYFMTIPEAVSLILQAGAYAKGGEVFVLDMGSPMRIDDMARKMIRLSGFEPDVDIKVEYTGLRPGEKLYEELLLKSEGLQKTENELIYIGHQRLYSDSEIQEKLAVLRGVLYADKPDVRKCMLSIIDEQADPAYEDIPVPDEPEEQEQEQKQEQGDELHV